MYTNSSKSSPDTAVLSTLVNGLTVVETLVGRQMSLRELAKTVELPRQTTYRIVHTLIEAGWVHRDSEQDVYSLSLRLWSLGLQSFNLGDLKTRFARTVRFLSREYGETVHLAAYERGSVVYIDKQEGSHPIRSYTELGGRAPAYCVATGKALLAFQADDEVEAVIAAGLHQFTPLTIFNGADLRNELSTVRSAGVAINRGEWREGVAGLAVPIMSPTGDALAGIGFSGPAERIMSQQARLAEALERAAVLTPASMDEAASQLNQVS